MLFPSFPSPGPWSVPPNSMTQGQGGSCLHCDTQPLSKAHRSHASHPGFQTCSASSSPLSQACWEIIESLVADSDPNPGCKPGRSGPVQMGQVGGRDGGACGGEGRLSVKWSIGLP